MKIWLDENYNIVKIEGGSHFTKGNHNFDILQVYVPTANIARDNTLPTFNFELANGRRYGPFTHNSGTVFEDSYTVFSYRLEEKLLSVEGRIFITISINYFNSNNTIYKSKNVNIQGNVISAVTMDNDVIILGNEEEILDSLQQKVDALNTRLSNVETATIQSVAATIDGNTGTPSVEVVMSGTPRERTFTLNFHNLKGEPGKQGKQGEQGIQGERGYPFKIMKSYASVLEMQESYDTDGLEVGDLVVIVSSVEDADDAKLYTKGAYKYEFLVDMSGATGIIGPQGPQGEPGTEIYAGGTKQLTWNADTKQDKLISGTNIKTVNGVSLVGAGNVSISAAYTHHLYITGMNIYISATIVSDRSTGYTADTLQAYIGSYGVIMEEDRRMLPCNGFITDGTSVGRQVIGVDFISGNSELEVMSYYDGSYEVANFTFANLVDAVH